MDGALERLAQLLRGKRVTVLTGAGCSTESGIPDYRGADTPRVRASIQHREFIEKPEYRQRYWARSLLGWPRLRSALPNSAHHALVEMQRAGIAAGLITQNVDGLHSAAGHAAVVELHGALARVKCLACGQMVSRDDLQEALRHANPRFVAESHEVKMTPDGDAELADDLVADFALIPCDACGGVMMPDVVFFGGSVPKPTLDAAWSAFDAGEALLVVGSSLTVFSGYRFVRRAAERGIPIAILNRGPTRGDEHATVRCDARAGLALPALVRALA
ncbi:MAG TPA: NAD-dependent protein deacetylase [Kofleriaceae bacterium]